MRIVVVPESYGTRPAAMRASNGVALLLLFIGGFLLAGYAGFRRGITAVVYVLIGDGISVDIIKVGGMLSAIVVGIIYFTVPMGWPL